MENNNVKKVVSSIINNTEISQTESNKRQISARELLIVEKKIHDKKRNDIKDFIISLKRDFPYIDDIVFYKDLDLHYQKDIIIWVKFNKECSIKYGSLENSMMLRYHDGFIEFLNPIGVISQIQKSINSNKITFISLAEYAINHNLASDVFIHTISDDFKLGIFDNQFTISNNYDFQNQNAKYFKLIYDYKQQLEKGFMSEDGMFKLDTNICGISGLFTNKSKKTNPLSLFLDNLKVYSDDVPEYIKKKLK